MALIHLPRKKGIWIVASLAAAMILLAAAWIVVTSNSFAKRVAAIRAAGDPASLAELAPKTIPAQENAAAQLASVMPRIDAFGNEHGRFFNTPVGKTYDERSDAGEPPTAEQAAAINAILAKYADVDEAIAKAAACPRYASRLDYSLPTMQFQTEQLALAQNIRTASRFLGWHAEIARIAGQPAEAVEYGIKLLKLGRLYESEPLITNRLVAVAIRSVAAASLYDSLASGEIPNELHDELDVELARQDDNSDLIRTLKQERAYSITFLEEQTANPGRLMMMNPMLWRFKSMQSGVLDWYERALPAIGQPWHEFQADPETQRIFQTPTGFGTLADLLLPSIQATYEAVNRATATMRSLRVYNALRKYVDTNGRDPSGLADLGLPANATIDPFTGKPLILKHTGDGWIVYSVGRDGHDDGGSLKDQKDCGVGPPKAR
jgi:hypothetical protein